MTLSVYSFYNHPVILQSHSDGCQRLPRTGAGYTVTIVDTKQRQMRCALNQGTVEVEELVRLPIERTAGMRTMILIGIHSGTTPHEKDVTQPVICLKGEPPSAGIGQRLQSTQALLCAQLKHFPTPQNPPARIYTPPDGRLFPKPTVARTPR